MKATIVLPRVVFPLVIVASSALASEAGRPGPAKDFVLTDLVPGACFENSTGTRVVVENGEDEKLRSKAEWPTHKFEMIIMGARVTLKEGGVGFFSAPPKKLEVAGPKPGFAGGMLSPEWFSGAVHIFHGTISVDQYTFVSDKTYPLTFKVVKDRGYAHLCGKGSVKSKAKRPTKLGHEDTIAHWISRSTSTDALAREGCAQALGYLAQNVARDEKESAVKTLGSLLTDKSFEVRRNAIESIVRLRATRQVASILEDMAQNDRNEWVKACAAWALRKKTRR